MWVLWSQILRITNFACSNAFMCVFNQSGIMICFSGNPYKASLYHAPRLSLFMTFVGKLLKVQHYWITTRNIHYSMKFTRNHQPTSIDHASSFYIFHDKYQKTSTMILRSCWKTFNISCVWEKLQKVFLDHISRRFTFSLFVLVQVLCQMNHFWI